MRKHFGILALSAALAGFSAAILLPAQVAPIPGAPTSFPAGPAIREGFVGLTSKNTYTPMPTKNPDGTSTTHPPRGVLPISDEIRTEYNINPFYKKYISIGPIIVMGSEKVSDYALLEAAYTFDHQLYNSPKYVIDALKTAKVRHAILSVVEFTMDLPENNRNGQNSAVADGAFQDRRSRGLGGLPQSSSGEENLLNLRGDPYGGRNGLQGEGENITIHEFSHTLASAIRRFQGGGRGRGTPDPEGSWGAKMDAAYAKAMAPGGRLFEYNAQRGGRVYASNTWQEYWAEGAQAWFDNANPGNSGGISIRQDVKDKDPALAEILKETYGDEPWRYFKTTARLPDLKPMRPEAELAHLAGLEDVRSQIPNFSHNNSPRVVALATQPGAQRSGGGGGGGGGRGGRGRGGATQPGTQPATGPATAPGRGQP